MMVIVFIRGDRVYQETLSARDLPDACRQLRKRGLQTFDTEGEVWFPPHMIEVVRPRYE